MPWPVHPNGLLGAQGDQDTYRIERSLRFNSANSAYLNRTPASAGNRKTWTWSGWVKKTVNGQILTLIECTPNATNQIHHAYFASSDVLGYYFEDPGYKSQITTSAIFRDPSAWYHIVLVWDTTQATVSNRSKIYVNGVQQSVNISNVASGQFPQNYDCHINRANTHNINKEYTPVYGSGYMTEINFIDGQALTPSSFGETDAITGRWKAKAYSGTYGTNGFYLKFADNSGTTATTLGKDSSGNGNNWTPNNFSVTAGAGNDSLVDSPTNYGTDSGVGGEVRGNYCTINPLDFSGAGTISNGNLQYVQSTLNARGGRSTFAVNSGKWYWEVTNNGGNNCVGIIRDTGAINATYIGGNADGWGYFIDGQKYNNGSGVNYGASYTTNDVIGIALNMDAGTLVFYKNGVSQGTAFSGLSGTMSPAFSSSNTSAVSFTANFGQRPFAYAAPSGFKALCTTNLSKDTAITTSGTFTGNASADGPFIWLNGTPTAMTINGNAVSFGTHADKLANGFKIRSSLAAYNASGSNTFSVSTTERKFKYARAQAN